MGASDPDDFGDEDHTNVTDVIPLVVLDDDTARLPPAARLVCVAGADLGRTFLVGVKPLVIGRGAGDIALRATDVSRSHARLQMQEGGFVLEDLGSANRTYVNGQQVDKPVVLRAGDRIQIGSTILVFAHHDVLEERMVQLQRLEAMSALAGGLAHDFNNVLTVILGNLQLFEMQLPAEDLEARRALAEMKEAAESGAALIRRLLRLGRTDPVTFELVKLAPLVERTAGMMKRQAQGQIKVMVGVEPELAVSGSYEELYQVMLNLLLNARDAIPAEGTVRIEARRVAFDGAQALARQLPAAGDYVELTVSDSGVGMDEATLARVFEPFFTTKPVGKGTGLGLAMVHGIVRRHGGTVVVESARQRGTTFRILLPAAVRSDR